MPQLEESPRPLRRLAKAMVNAADSIAVFPNDGQGVVPGVSLMDHHVEPELGGERDLFAEDDGLAPLFGRILGREGVGVGFRPFSFAARDGAGQPMIIETGLADGGDFRMLGELAKRGDPILRGFHGGGGVDADDRVDLRIAIRQRDGAGASLHGGPNAVEAGDAGRRSAFKDAGKVVGEFGKIEMGVGIGEQGSGCGM